MKVDLKRRIAFIMRILPVCCFRLMTFSSPIIQDGRLVGAVTHVFIEDTAKGYGIFADEMYSKTSELAESTIENAG